MQNANFWVLCPEIIILIHYGRYCDEVDTLLIYRGLLTPSGQVIWLASRKLDIVCDGPAE